MEREEVGGFLGAPSWCFPWVRTSVPLADVYMGLPPPRNKASQASGNLCRPFCDRLAPLFLGVGVGDALLPLPVLGGRGRGVRVRATGTGCRGGWWGRGAGGGMGWLLGPEMVAPASLPVQGRRLSEGWADEGPLLRSAGA